VQPVVVPKEGFSRNVIWLVIGCFFRQSKTNAKKKDISNRSNIVQKYQINQIKTKNAVHLLGIISGRMRGGEEKLRF